MPGGLREASRPGGFPILASSKPPVENKPMSDRVQTAIVWLKWILQTAGVLLTLLGGSQAANIAPQAFGGGNSEAASTNTLIGLAMTFLAPGIAKLVSAFWAWKRGKKATPLLDYGFALGCVANLREYLIEVPGAAAPLDQLKAFVVKVEADRVDPPAPAAEAK